MFVFYNHQNEEEVSSLDIKGQLISESIYEVIVLPKYEQKIVVISAL